MFDASKPDSFVLPAVLTASPLAVCILQPPEPTISFANPMLGRIFELDPAGFRSFRELIARLEPRFPDQRPIPFDELPGIRALRGEQVQNFEIVIVSGKGNTKHVMCNSAPVHGSDGRLVAAVDMFWDITATRQLEHSRNTLLAAISHELRTPLSTIQITADHLRRQGAPVAQVDRIVHSVETLEALSRDLMAFALIEANELRLDVHAVDVGDLLGTLLEKSAPVLTRHPVSLAAPDSPISIPADPLRIQQIVGNLLTNAGRYSPAGEPVEVALTTDGEWAEIRVSDRGPGIADDEKISVFDPFRTGRRRSSGSIGLGLHIAKGLVLEHGGHISVEDRPGGGSVFVVKLPVAKPPA